jgi:hypothetical protein
MLTQRWRDRRDSYRARGDAFHPGEFGVESIARDGVAREFIERNHYSGSYPAARCRVGLYRRREGWFTSELVGVAVYSVPVQAATIPCYVPGVTASEGVELGRFVLLDEVPFNAESWFLARAEAIVRRELGVRAVLSYSDPLPRRDASGRVVTPGHVGQIYQARNALYLGMSRGMWHHLTPAGRFLSKRGISKIRGQEQGWEGAAAALMAEGAPARRVGEDPAAWVARALVEGPFTRVKHPGNHVYVWCFDAGARKGVEVVGPYPKKGGH